MFGDPVTNPMGWKMLTVEKAVEEGIIARPLDGNHGEKHPKGTDYVESGVPFIMGWIYNLSATARRQPN